MEASSYSNPLPYQHLCLSIYCRKEHLKNIEKRAENAELRETNGHRKKARKPKESKKARKQESKKARKLESKKARKQESKKARKQERKKEREQNNQQQIQRHQAIIASLRYPASFKTHLLPFAVFPAAG